jgi:selenide,water dikinase
LRHIKTTSADPALLVGLDAPDDAAVYRVSDDAAIVQTVDFFTPIVDDPFAWGRIAAANAMSDVYAMGARPLTALSLVAWPRGLDMELLGRVLDGAGEACDEGGVAIVGGHSIDDPEPKFGLAVTGTVHPDRIVRKSGAEPGAELVLTKPLGMGIISSGIKEQKTSAATAEEAIAVMSALNKDACDAMLEIGPAAATDVTGFGLIGHLLQMLDGKVSAELWFDAVPVLEEAFELAEAGVFPGGSKRNRDAMEDSVDAARLSESQRAVLYDSQTSGGLLIAVDPKRTGDLLAALERRGVEGAVCIGRVIKGHGRIEVVA